MATETGTDRAIHEELGEQGIAGLFVVEEHGGAGLAALDATIAAQELARVAAPVSYHSAYVMAPLLLQEAGSEAQKEKWLTGIADGSALLSVVVDGLTLVNGKIQGTAMFVPDGGVADAYIVLAEGADGAEASLALVPANRAGVRATPLATIDDTRRVVELDFEGVAVGDEDVLGTADATATMARAVNVGRIMLAADALGAAQEGLRIAVDYAKGREQFNRVIASFQAVKHMCAEVIAEIDPVQSLLWYTAYAFDHGLEEAANLVPTLKAHATEAASFAVETCTQVFGGIGFTQECDMNLYFKRASYDRQMLGGPAEMRRIAAALQFGEAGAVARQH
jgi:alkylation response protein AidB-like acyl-CoA dehydrogenase